MNDESKMPFGKYKDTKLIEVPASYLLWLYEQDDFKIAVTGPKGDLRRYIEENMDVLKKETNNK